MAGSRKILNISEVTGVEHGRVETQDVERTGVRDDGKVQGRFKWTGIQPKMLERLRIMGVSLPDGVFDEVMEVNMD